jgi:cytochrome c oxidase subunit 2
MVTADESYIRESILDPKAKVVAGYDTVMPEFKGQISEEQLAQLIAFIKAIGPKGQTGIGGIGTSEISGSRPGVR